MLRAALSLLDGVLALFRTPARRQVAALCWRRGEAGVEILLITTRNTGRWTPPRGWPMEGETAPGAAAIEAWEEAGVVGAVGEEPVGVYRYDKLESVGSAGAPIDVTVFPLKVERLDDEFREAGQRDRRWMTAAAAAEAVREPGLKRIFATFEP